MRAQPLVQFDVAAFVKEVEIVIGEQRHWRVPLQRRPSSGFVPGWAGRGGASWAALYWLLVHFEEESPPRDLPDSQARYWPYCRPKTDLPPGRNEVCAASAFAVGAPSGQSFYR